MASQVKMRRAAMQNSRTLQRLLVAVSVAPEEIGARIREARKRKGWSQLDLAVEAHVSPGTVYRWEKGQLPRVRELMRVADLLEVPTEELVEPMEPSVDREEERLRQIVQGELASLRTQMDRIEKLLGDVGEGPPPKR